MSGDAIKGGQGKSTALVRKEARVREGGSSVSGPWIRPGSKADGEWSLNYLLTAGAGARKVKVHGTAAHHVFRDRHFTGRA